MKIEKISENQIRCILTKQDLIDRQIKLSELAYGSAKAKNLFRDLMELAADEYGFEADDIPLMVEAIPLPSESIILIVTKVENPEELDTRFSKFAPMEHDGPEPPAHYETEHISIGADDILDFMKHLKEAHEAASKAASSSAAAEFPGSAGNKQTIPADLDISVAVDITKMYSFVKLDHAFELARVLSDYYNGENSIYRHPANKRFYLTLSKSQHTPEEFNKVCNILSEYAVQESYTPAAESFLKEHGTTIILSNALQTMSQI